jgi:hypothetical protein
VEQKDIYCGALAERAMKTKSRSKKIMVQINKLKSLGVFFDGIEFGGGLQRGQ